MRRTLTWVALLLICPATPMSSAKDAATAPQPAQDAPRLEFQDIAGVCAVR
jgi:hypothetical protein